MVSFYHVSSEKNLADILTRTYNGEPQDLPYIGDIIPETQNAILYSAGVQSISLANLPEVDTKQIVSNMNISGDLVGVVSLNYMLQYNLSKQGGLVWETLDQSIEWLQASWRSIQDISL